MDKKFVFRQFKLRPFTDSETKQVFTELIMDTSVEGPFGPIVLRTSMRLDGDNIVQIMTVDSAAPANLTFSLRCGEMSYFINEIVPLFNPINTTNYEVPSSSQSQD